MAARAVAGTVVLLSTAVLAFAGWITSLPHAERLGDNVYFVGVVGGASLEWELTGLVLIWLRPRNVLGWLFLATGASSMCQIGLNGYGVYGATIAQPAWPAADVVAAASTATWMPAVIAPSTIMLAYYPNGWLPARWWRWPVAAVATVMLLLLATLPFYPEAFADSSPGVDPPPALPPLVLGGCAVGRLCPRAGPVNGRHLGGHCHALGARQAARTPATRLVRLYRRTAPGCHLPRHPRTRPGDLRLPGAGGGRGRCAAPSAARHRDDPAPRSRLRNADRCGDRGLPHGDRPGGFGTGPAPAARHDGRRPGGRDAHSSPSPAATRCGPAGVRSPPGPPGCAGPPGRPGRRRRRARPPASRAARRLRRRTRPRGMAPDGSRLGAWGSPPVHGHTVALQVGGRDVGALEMARRNPADTYTEADVRLLAAMAAQVAVLVRALELTQALQAQRDRVVAATRTCPIRILDRLREFCEWHGADHVPAGRRSRESS